MSLHLSALSILWPRLVLTRVMAGGCAEGCRWLAHVLLELPGEKVDVPIAQRLGHLLHAQVALHQQVACSRDASGHQLLLGSTPKLLPKQPAEIPRGEATGLGQGAGGDEILAIGLQAAQRLGNSQHLFPRARMRCQGRIMTCRVNHPGGTSNTSPGNSG